VSIGQSLRAARERAGLTVEQVAATTRIRQTLVRAIEDDDHRLCGGDFYARGHIRNIAVAVGTDPAPLVAEFDATRPVEAPRASEVFEPDAVRAERRGPNWTAAMAAALVLVVVYGVTQAVTGGSSGDRAPLAAGPSSPPPVRSGPVAPSGAASQPSPPPAVARAPRDRVTVVVRAQARSWVQATAASGRELFQGLLDPGQVKTFTDKARVRLLVGNAGGVSLTVNGTGIGAPGRAGQVARVHFGPDDPAAG
jgi:cytoskeletal protein RodZ